MKHARQDYGWLEDYACGCVSEIAEFKKDLFGYCGIHGDERRQVWPVNRGLEVDSRKRLASARLLRRDPNFYQ